ALDALAGVVGAPAPADCKAEHLAQHCERAIGLGGGTGAELVMKGVHVGVGDSGNLRSAKGRQDVGCDLLPVDALCRWPLAWNVILLEAGGEVRNGRRGAALLLFTDRIAAAVDLALEPLGLFACCCCVPVGKRADGEPPFATVHLAVVVQDEGSTASGCDPTAEALYCVVVGDLVAVFWRRNAVADYQSASWRVSAVSVMCPYRSGMAVSYGGRQSLLKSMYFLRCHRRFLASEAKRVSVQE